MRQQQYFLRKSCHKYNIFTTICLKTADIWAQQQYRDISVPCLLSNSVPLQISRCSCVSGKSFAQNLQVRLSEGLLPFWFILTNAIHLDLYLKYTLQLDRDNLWRYCVSSGLRSTLSFDLLPSCILFKHSSLILALIACLISFFVTSVAMTLGRPRDKHSVLDSVARPLILCIVSCISTFLVMLFTGLAIILFTKINFL